MGRVAARLAGSLCLISVLAFANCASAQNTKTYRIGFLTPASAASIEDRLSRFRQGMRELGYVDQSATIEFRSAEGKQEKLDELAAELNRLGVDVVLTHGVVATLSAKRASAKTPIVCFACG